MAYLPSAGHTRFTAHRRCICIANPIASRYLLSQSIYMSVYIGVALIVTVWVMIAVVGALVVGRAVVLRDRHETPRRPEESSSKPPH